MMNPRLRKGLLERRRPELYGKNGKGVLIRALYVRGTHGNLMADLTEDGLRRLLAEKEGSD
jgi:hypothetical protein